MMVKMYLDESDCSPKLWVLVHQPANQNMSDVDFSVPHNYDQSDIDIVDNGLFFNIQASIWDSLKFLVSESLWSQNENQSIFDDQM